MGTSKRSTPIPTKTGLDYLVDIAKLTRISGVDKFQTAREMETDTYHALEVINDLDKVYNETGLIDAFVQKRFLHFILGIIFDKTPVNDSRPCKYLAKLGDVGSPLAVALAERCESTEILLEQTRYDYVTPEAVAQIRNASNYEKQITRYLQTKDTMTQTMVLHQLRNRGYHDMIKSIESALGRQPLPDSDVARSPARDLTFASMLDPFSLDECISSDIKYMRKYAREQGVKQTGTKIAICNKIAKIGRAHV